MNTIQKILTGCCLGLMALSFAACAPADQVRTVDTNQVDMTPAQTGADLDDGQTREFK